MLNPHFRDAEKNVRIIKRILDQRTKAEMNRGSSGADYIIDQIIYEQFMSRKKKIHFKKVTEVTGQHNEALRDFISLCLMLKTTWV